MHNFFGQFNPHIKLDKSFAKMLLIFLLIAVLTAVAFYLQFKYENIFTHGAKQAEDGVLVLSDEDLEKNPFRFLVDRWEFYDFKLLTPEDFKNSEHVPYVLDVGSNFVFEDEQGGRYKKGYGTFRMNIEIPKDSRRYALEIPEIFTASKVFINGTLFSELGETDPERFSPQVDIGEAVFEAAGNIEIIIQTTNYNHISSSLIYPPVFGYADDVLHVLHMRFFIRVMAITIALMLGIIQLAIGIFTKKNRIAIVYALMCFFFIVCVGYPITHTLINLGAFPCYYLEDMCYVFMMLTIVIIQCNICKVNKIVSGIAVTIAVTWCIMVFIAPHLVGNNFDIILLYWDIWVAYRWLIAIFMNIITILSLNRLTSKILMGGLTVVNVSMIAENIADRIAAEYYGFIYSSVPTEIAGFVMVLTFALIMCVGIINRYRESIFLETRLAGASKLVEMQRAYFPFLTEQINQTKIMRHDLRHHLLVEQSLLSEGDFTKLAEYIANLRGTVDNQAPLTYCDNYVTNVIVGHYAGIAAEKDVKLTAQIQLDEELSLDDADLCCIFSNLLENAIEACEKVTENRYINVDIHPHGEYLYVNAENSKAGTILRSGEKIYTSKPDTTSHGYGLLTIQNIVEKYNGMVDIIHDENTFKIKLAVKVL